MLRRCAVESARKLRNGNKRVPPALEAVTQVWDYGPHTLTATTTLLAQAARIQSSVNARLRKQNHLLWAADLLREELRKADRPRLEIAIAQYNLALVYAAAREWDKAKKLFADSSESHHEGWESEEMRLWGDALKRQMKNVEATGAVTEASATR